MANTLTAEPAEPSQAEAAEFNRPLPADVSVLLELSRSLTQRPNRVFLSSLPFKRMHISEAQTDGTAAACLRVASSL